MIVAELPKGGPAAMPKALLIVPANNTTMEPEILAHCPEFSPLMVARVPRPARTLTRDDLPAYGESTRLAVAPFVAEKPDIVIYGCTAAGFLGGPAGNAAMTAALGQTFGVPVVSTAAAMGECLEFTGARHVAMVTPYLPAVNDGLKDWLAGLGIGVTVLESFLCQTTEALGRITAAEVRGKALATMTAGSDAMFIACSQLPTLEILPELRQAFGRPVWSSIQGTAWSALRALGLPAGRLDGRFGAVASAA